MSDHEINGMLHILRNPYGHSEQHQRQARLDAADEIERLRQWIMWDCNCPCCEQTEQCLSECTFHKDATDAFERMQEARKVLGVQT